MVLRKGNDYFEFLAELVDYSCSSANLLYNTLSSFNIDELELKLKELHEIEHSADLKKHDMMNKLVKEFITPIERGDIIELAHQIDNVTDAIEDVLVRIYMCNISSMRPEALDFSNLLIKTCALLKELLLEFRNYKKSSNHLNKLIIDINMLEEDGDRLYIKSVKNIYSTCQNPIELMAWKDVFKYFERCCDACEHAANVVESVIMKNS